MRCRPGQAVESPGITSVQLSCTLPSDILFRRAAAMETDRTGLSFRHEIAFSQVRFPRKVSLTGSIPGLFLSRRSNDVVELLPLNQRTPVEDPPFQEGFHGWYHFRWFLGAVGELLPFQPVGSCGRIPVVELRGKNDDSWIPGRFAGDCSLLTLRASGGSDSIRRVSPSR